MEQDLVNYGLSEKEAKLYLLCLKTGETTANRMIKLSGMPRGTTYDILNKLKGMGLISSIIKDHGAVYLANDPEILVKDLDEKKEEIQKIIPELRKISKTLSASPEIEVFGGLSGIKKILDEILEDCKEVIIMGNEKYAREVIRHHPENFRMKRLERKIKIKNLLEESKISRLLQDDAYSQVRHHPSLKESKEVLIIYKDNAVHIIMEEPIKIIKIASKEYTRTQKILFESLWETAKK